MSTHNPALIGRNQDIATHHASRCIQASPCISKKMKERTELRTLYMSCPWTKIFHILAGGQCNNEANSQFHWCASKRIQQSHFPKSKLLDLLARALVEGLSWPWFYSAHTLVNKTVFETRSIGRDFLVLCCCNLSKNRSGCDGGKMGKE